MDQQAGARWAARIGVVAFVVTCVLACSSTHEDEEREDTDNASTLGKSRSSLNTSVNANADTYLRQGSPNQNQGALTYMRLQASGDNRGLVRFDQSSMMSSFTSGSTVSLRLHISYCANNWGPSGRQIALHRLTHDWTELGATWNCSLDSNTSNSNDDCAGATAWEMGSPQHPELHPWIATPTATAIITSNQSGDVTFDVTSDVDQFRSGAATNYGWLIRKTDEGAAGHVEFATHETSTPPVLLGSCTDADDSGTCDQDGGGGNDGGQSNDSGQASDTGNDTGTSCSPANCDDGEACTTDQCTASGCTHVPVTDGTSCSDQNACTTSDHCSAGHCVGGTGVDPNDGNPCTVDTCDVNLGIIHTPSTAGSPCPNGTLCDGNETCDGAGSCQSGTPPTVDDGNPCTDDACDAINGVTHTPRATGDLACNDANACNGIETCNGAGACTSGTPPTIDDGNICTADSCSPITGPVHTPIPNCDPTPTGGDGPFEPRASLMGKLLAGTSPVTGVTFTVTDLPPINPTTPNAPRSDVAVSSSSDGSFRLRLTSFPDAEAERTPPKHVQLKIESSAYLPVYRDAWVHTGDAVDLGVIRFVSRDSAVTNIGPAGGTASDSQNRIQIVIPAGALATTIPIRITPIVLRDEMPARLPDTTPTLYGAEFEPDGTTFSEPVSVRFSNWRNIPTTAVIPYGTFDTTTGRWEHEGFGTWNGTRFEVQTTHFSTVDLNAARFPGTDNLRSGNGPCTTCGPNQCVGSACNMLGGGLQQDVNIATYKVKNEDFGFTLAYDSALASSQHVGQEMPGYASVSHAPTFQAALRPARFTLECVPRGAVLGTATVSQPGLCNSTGSACSWGPTATPIPLTATMAIGGAQLSQTLTPNGLRSDVEVDSSLPLPMSLQGTSVASPGFYRTSTEFRAQTGSCVALTANATFGVADPDALGTQTTLEPGPLGTLDVHTFVNHRVASPFGAGWSIPDLSRVYRKGDVAYRTAGNRAEHFKPRAHTRGVPTTGLQAPARDERTGEIFTTTSDGRIVRVNPDTGATTNILTIGVTNARSLAVGYVGSTRHFVVAHTTALIDVDSAGATRTIATRSNVASQPMVAAHDDLVFYTDAITSIVHRARLSDASPSLTALTLATGGDVRLYPRSPLSGLSFSSVRALAIDSNGVLFIADRRRHTVYAAYPAAVDGVVGPTSLAEPAIGDGGLTTIAPLGERYPGQRFTLREPIGLSMADDGTLFAMTTFGLVSYDPVAREAEWLARWGSVEENVTVPYPPFNNSDVGFVGLGGSSIMAHSDASSSFSYVRFDVDRLSSEFDPTRTLRSIGGGQLELLDTTKEKVERFDTAGRLIERRKRTSEIEMSVQYADAQSDRPLKIIDPVGGENIFSYDGSNKLQRITDARGRITEFTVNGLGDLVSTRDPGNETMTFGYAEHRMTDKFSPRGDHTTYTFRANGTMQSATKPEGATTVVSAGVSQPADYDATGTIIRPASYTDAHGVAHAVVIDDAGQIVRDTYTADGVARVMVASYDGVASGSIVGIVYDQNGNPTGIASDLQSGRRNPVSLRRIKSRAINGYTLEPPTIFDAHGRPREVNAILLPPGGSTYKNLWTYDANGWLKSKYTGPGSPRQNFERDPSGHITAIIDVLGVAGGGFGDGAATGRETRWTYRADGLPSTMTEHNIARTFTYDDVGGTKNESGWTDTLGRSMAYTRDPRGNITSTFDGVATTFAGYDLKNRLVESRDALGNATTYGYSHAGCNCSQENLVTNIHTPDLPIGVDWEMDYDADSRLKSVTDPHGFTESYEYEATGELKKTIDKLLRQTAWTHDQLGRVGAMTDTASRAHPNTYAVEDTATSSLLGPTLMAGSADASAPSTSLTGTMRNGDYQIGHNAYNSFGWPAQISLYQDATLRLGYTEYYDLGKRMNRREDRVALAFSSTTIPSQSTLGQFRDEQISYTTNDPNPFITGLGSSTASGFENASFTRNPWFEVTSQTAYANLSGNNLTQTLGRDAGGRITSQSWVWRGGPPATSTYTYRPDGRISQIVNPDGTHDFTYNSRGLVETQTVVGEGTYTYGYDELGRNNFLEFPDAHTRTQVFDDLGRITSRCYEYSLGTVRCYTAQYDAVGNPVQMTDPDGVDTIEYDNLDRLKKVTRTVGASVVSVEDYAYNALGALSLNAGVALDHQRPRLDGGGSADAAVPATLGGQPVTLDAGGSITSLKGATYNWSRQGFLHSIQPPSPATLIEFGTDAELRRYHQRQLGSLDDINYYEGLDRVAVLDGATPTTVKEAYLFDGVDHPLRIKKSGMIVYYELDLAGNVRGLRASGGASLGQYRFTAFGKTVEDTTTMVQALRWKSRWHSLIGSTEIYDVRARHWNSEMGNFLSIDGYEFHSLTTTLWGWPSQNPARLVDTTGHNACEDECTDRFKKASDECVKKCGDAGASCYLDCTEEPFNEYDKCRKRCQPPPPPPPPPRPEDPCARGKCPASCSQ